MQIFVLLLLLLLLLLLQPIESLPLEKLGQGHVRHALRSHVMNHPLKLRLERSIGIAVVAAILPSSITQTTPRSTRRIFRLTLRFLKVEGVEFRGQVSQHVNRACVLAHGRDQ